MKQTNLQDEEQLLSTVIAYLDNRLSPDQAKIIEQAATDVPFVQGLIVGVKAFYDNTDLDKDTLPVYLNTATERLLANISKLS